MSFIWPEDVDGLATLRGAVELAMSIGTAPVVPGDAATDTARLLAGLPGREPVVVFTASLLSYLNADATMTACWPWPIPICAGSPSPAARMTTSGGCRLAPTAASRVPSILAGGSGSTTRATRCGPGGRAGLAPAPGCPGRGQDKRAWRGARGHRGGRQAGLAPGAGPGGARAAA